MTIPYRSRLHSLLHTTQWPKKKKFPRKKDERRRSRHRIHETQKKTPLTLFSIDIIRSRTRNENKAGTRKRMNTASKKDPSIDPLTILTGLDSKPSRKRTYIPCLCPPPARSWLYIPLSAATGSRTKGVRKEPTSSSSGRGYLPFPFPNQNYYLHRIRNFVFVSPPPSGRTVST